MSDGSPIEWTNASWNPVRGCDKVSAGCKNCYAETFSERWRGIKGHPFEQGFDLRLVPEALEKPLRWKKPRKIFVNSMSDLFHEDIPNEYIAAVFGVMAACPQHTFQVLTKRAARMREWFDWLPSHYDGPRTVPPWASEELRHRLASAHDVLWPLPNVHLGISAENQETADARIPLLLECPAAVRWVSAEPLLGPIDLNRIDATKAGWRAVNGFPEPAAISAFGKWQERPMRARLQNGIDWVVVGGESGLGARACDVAWIRSIVEQCRAADVPAFVKQLGASPFDRTMPVSVPVPPGTRLGHICRDGVFRMAAADSEAVLFLKMQSRKGGDPNEWPEDLRVREFPRSAT